MDIMSDYSGSKITAIGRQFPIGTVYNYVEDVVVQSKSSCNVGNVCNVTSYLHMKDNDIPFIFHKFTS